MEFIIQRKENDGFIEIPFCLDDVPDNATDDVGNEDSGVWVEYYFTRWTPEDDLWRRERWFVQVDKLNPSESYLIDVNTVETIYIKEHQHEIDVESIRLEKIRFVFKDWWISVLLGTSSTEKPLRGKEE